MLATKVCALLLAGAISSAIKDCGQSVTYDETKMYFAPTSEINKYVAAGNELTPGQEAEFARYGGYPLYPGSVGCLATNSRHQACQ